MIDTTQIKTIIDEIKTKIKKEKVRYIEYYDKIKDIPLSKLTLRVENGNVSIVEIEAQTEVKYD
jgi:hypothetical protein